MFRSLALAAALGVVALPAAAASVTVNIAGLDAKTAHARIVHAARAACNEALQDSAVVRYYGMGTCIDDAVAAAEAKIAGDHHYATIQNGR